MTPVLGALLVAGVALVVMVVGLASGQRSVDKPAPIKPKQPLSLQPRDLLVQLRTYIAERFEPPADTEEHDTRYSKLAVALSQAALPINPSEFQSIRIGLAVLLGLIALFRFGVSVGPLVFAAVGFFLPSFYLRYRQGLLRKNFDQYLPDTLTIIGNAVQSGQSVVQALDEVANNGVPPVSTEFGRAMREVRLGANLDTALGKIVDRTDSSDLELVALSIRIQRESGGNLPEVLNTIGETIRDRRRLRDELQVATAQVRSSAWLITALPVALGGVLLLIAPDYFKPMLSQPVGWVMIGIGALLLFAGNWLIGKLTAIR